MSVKVGDKIGMIQKYCPAHETKWRYRLVISDITSIRTGKKGTKAYSKRFRPLDIEELESNAMWLDKVPTALLVGEPFLCTPHLQKRAEWWIEREGWLDDKR